MLDITGIDVPERPELVAAGNALRTRHIEDRLLRACLIPLLLRGELARRTSGARKAKA